MGRGEGTGRNKDERQKREESGDFYLHNNRNYVEKERQTQKKAIAAMSYRQL